MAVLDLDEINVLCKNNILICDFYGGLYCDIVKHVFLKYNYLCGYLSCPVALLHVTSSP